jgi:hypothetical protein
MPGGVDMGLEIRLRRDVSINRLLEIHRQGGSVLRTPHVGNWFPANMLLAEAGVRMLVYDLNRTHKDRSSHPHCVLCDGQAELLCAADRQVSRARVETPSRRFPQFFRAGASIGKGHVAALRAAFPAASLDLYTGYLQARAGRVLEILDALARAQPGLWRRYVTADGTVEARTYAGASPLPAEIFGLTCGDAGWLIPNLAALVLLTVLEQRERGVGEIWHLAGEDMARYLFEWDHLDRMRSLHRAASTRLGLPDLPVLNVVPTGAVRLGTVDDSCGRLDELARACTALGLARASKRERLRRAPEAAREHLLREITMAEAAAGDRLAGAAAECADDILYEARSARFPSQYDLLARGRRFHVHPWALEMNIGELEELMRLIDRYRKGALRRRRLASVRVSGPRDGNAMRRTALPGAR